MMTLALSQIASWTRGALHGEDTRVRGVAIDSRTVAAGDLFVALKGEHSDGHAYLSAAATGGATAVLVAHPVDVAVPQVQVADTLVALGDIARGVRENSAAKVVCITGSNGKTTVKRLTAAILARVGPTHATGGNYNNEIGLPLTLFSMPAATRYAVLEMGAGKPGDIAYLAGIGEPVVSLVNSIAPAHLERMGSLQGIADTKGAIYSALPPDGTAIINADCDFAEYFTQLAGARRCLRFGWDAANAVHASVDELAADHSRFRLHTPAGSIEVRLALPGRHNVANAMAAAAIATALEVPLAQIAIGLAGVEPVAGRLAAQAMPGGWTLIDDSYNANPGSVAAGIDALLLVPGEHWLVLGDMAELGAEAAALHAQVGALARERGVDALFTLGPLAAEAAGAYGAGAHAFTDRAALIAALRSRLHAQVACLVKGSHAAAMDRVVAALVSGGNAHVA